MANKKPWKVLPNMGGRQAYVHTDESGTAWIRQSLRTEDGRVLWFDMTPEESASLMADVESARMDLVADTQMYGGTHGYPDARF